MNKLAYTLDGRKGSLIRAGECWRSIWQTPEKGVEVKKILSISQQWRTRVMRSVTDIQRQIPKVGGG